MRWFAAATAFVCVPLVVGADEDAFVEANLLSILYHELGHALIEVMDLPVLGQEEDAADTLSVVMIDALYDDQDAMLAGGASLGSLADAADDEAPAFWDVHGPSEQRYYNAVCLFYGAAPEARAEFAEDMGLPEDRAETCVEEFDLAAESWGGVLDDLMNGAGVGLVFEGEAHGFAETLVADEVAAQNEIFTFPEAIVVRVDDCGEVNAFFDPEDTSITICSEFGPYLRRAWVDLG